MKKFRELREEWRIGKLAKENFQGEVPSTESKVEGDLEMEDTERMGSGQESKLRTTRSGRRCLHTTALKTSYPQCPQGGMRILRTSKQRQGKR